jgi:N-acyl-D-amino-acid deacylase
MKPVADAIGAPFDVVIAGGEVVDGLGGAPFRADVGVSGGRIVAVGELGACAAQTEVDARGCVVCPGFIDTHTHSDTYLLIEPDAPSKIYQGVTTEVTGNCGASAAPLAGAARLPADWEAMAYPHPWRSFGEYRMALRAVKPAVNVAPLIGHNTLRAGIAGYGTDPASEAQVVAMGRMLADALEQGAHGMSLGLAYIPGRYAAASEVVALARELAAKGGLLTTHMRSEGDRLLESLEEMLGLVGETGVRLLVSHLKVSGPDNWHKIDALLERLHGCPGIGSRVVADRYPYTYSCTDLDVVLPAWLFEGGRTAAERRLRDRALRDKLIAEAEADRDEAGWERITLGSTTHPGALALRGTPLNEVAAALGLGRAETVVELVRHDAFQTSAYFHTMSEQNLIRILREPFVMVGSDASIRAPWGPLSHDWPHPRAYGTFPRFLKMAVDQCGMTLSEAIARCTSLPASVFGLADRGRIASDCAADIAVFDPDGFRDCSTPAAPHALAMGMQALLVNGTPTLLDGQPTGNRAGRLI